MGEPGINGGERGDLLVTILVDKHPVFQRQGYDIYSSEPISFTQAALGGKVQLNTIDGPYSYDIAPGTQTNTKVKLKGKGVPTLKTDEQKIILNQYENASGPAVNTRSSTDSAGDFSFGGHKKKKFRK